MSKHIGIDMHGRFAEFDSTDHMMNQAYEVSPDSHACDQKAALRENPNLWVSNDGKTREIKDMSTMHLINTIRYLQRTESTDIPQFKTMEAELARRQTEGGAK